MSTGKRTGADIEQQVRDSELVRWEGLRRTRNGGIVDLDNDGSLAQQLKGLTGWLESTIDFTAYPETGLKPNERDLALAYVARQITSTGEGWNTLLNAQGAGNKAEEAKRLRAWSAELTRDNVNLQVTLIAVADWLDGSKSDLSDAINGHLSVANACFYLETALYAAEAAEAALGDGDDETALAYRLIAANAFGNNHGKVTHLPEGHPIYEVLNTLRNDHPWVENEDLYVASLSKVNTQPSSQTGVTASPSPGIFPKGHAAPGNEPS